MGDVDEVLEHFGVKGMKWGIRKDKRRAGSSPVSPDKARAQAAEAIIKKHGTKALDNKDLQHLVNRMNLEKQYSGLVSEKQSTIDRGHSHVKKLLSYGKTANEVYKLVNSPLTRDIGKALGSGNSKPKQKAPSKPKQKFGFA